MPPAATCSHGVPAAAANHERSGERYGYADFVLRERILPKLNPKFIRIDVECKHKAFRQKVEVSVLESRDPGILSSAVHARILSSLRAAREVVGLLPDAHGQLHGLACQVSAL